MFGVVVKFNAFCCVVLSTLVLNVSSDVVAYHYDDLGNDWPGLCRTGTKQSPVTLTSPFVDPLLRALDFSSWASPKTFRLINNGHTIQIDSFDQPSFFTDPNTGVRYQLAQFHFHSPSEHVWGSGHADLELHLVHVRVGGNSSVGTDLLVIGLGFSSSEFAPNEFLNEFWVDLARVAMTNTNVSETKTLRLQSALPPSQDYFTYYGSLTTPPCTEGVKWYVMAEMVGLSDSQIEQIRISLHLSAVDKEFDFAGNRRMPQPLNGRLLRQFLSASSTAVAATSAPPASIVTVIEQDSSGLTLFVTFLNSLVLFCVVYSIRNTFEVPFFGNVFATTRERFQTSQQEAHMQPVVLVPQAVEAAPAPQGVVADAH